MRPDFVAMTVVFWIVSIPSWVGVGIAWICGLALDTLTGALLGEHAAALALIAWIAFRFHQRIRVFPLWQECFAVFLLLCVYHLVLTWVGGTIGRHLSSLQWIPVLTSVIVWPLWSHALNSAVRRVR